MVDEDATLIYTERDIKIVLGTLKDQEDEMGWSCISNL